MPFTLRKKPKDKEEMLGSSKTSSSKTRRPLPPTPDSNAEDSDSDSCYSYVDIEKISISQRKHDATTAGQNHPVSEIRMLSEAMEADEGGKEDVCQSSSCNRPVDGLCSSCYQAICFRCRRGICEKNNGAEHNFTDFEEYLAAKKDLYDMWYLGKKNNTIAIDREIRAIVLSIKNEGEKLVNNSIAGITSSLSQTITTLTNKQNELQALYGGLADARTILDYYTANIKKLSSAAFIQLVDRLIVPKSYKIKKFNVGTFDTFLSKACEYLALTKERNVLVCMRDSVQLFNQTSTSSTLKTPVATHVSGIQWWNGKLYVATEMDNKSSKIHMYDHHYAQCGNWIARIKVCDLAVSNEQVYLCTENCTVHVYTTMGTYLYEMPELGQRITHHPNPNILILTCHAKDRVSAVNGVTKEVLWSQEIDQPWGAYVDEYEVIWVWSEFNQEFFLYDDKGELQQKAVHPKMIGIGEINAICVHSGRLWIGYDGGIYRYKLGFC